MITGEIKNRIDQIWDTFYLKTIISYVCENGDITSNDLINVEPFSGYDWLGVFGPQAQGIGKFVCYLHNVIVA